MTHEETEHHLMISLRLHEQVCYLSCFISRHAIHQSLVRQRFLCRFLCIERGKISMAHRIFVCKTPVVFRPLFWCNKRNIRFLLWRYDIEGVGIQNRSGIIIHRTVKTDGYILVFSKRHLSEAILPVLRCPHHHVTLAGGKECSASGIGILGHYGTELSIVVYLEYDLCITYGFSIGINNGEPHACRLHIIIYKIYLRIV